MNSKKHLVEKVNKKKKFIFQQTHKQTFLLGHVSQNPNLILVKRDTKHPYVSTHPLLHRSLMYFLDTEVNRSRSSVHGMYRTVP